MEPNEERIQLWVDALRSGDYEQGVGMLTQVIGGDDECLHCCLGVACEVAIAGGLPLGKLRMRDTGGNRFVYGDSFSGGLLPPEVIRWYGLDDATGDPRLSAPNLAHGHGVASATSLNDSLRASFEVIANAVERTYLRED